jgi:hypothetical protein
MALVYPKDGERIRASSAKTTFPIKIILRYQGFPEFGQGEGIKEISFVIYFVFSCLRGINAAQHPTQT